MDLLSQYSKRPDLLVDLRKTSQQVALAGVEPDRRRSVRSSGRSKTVDKVADRLGPLATHEMVESFKSGTPKWKLGEQYGMSLSSVKRLLGKQGVKKPRGYPHSH